MKFAELNKKGTMPDNLNTDNFEYKKLLEFAGKTVVVRGFFFNEKGKYGKQVVVATNECLINIPKWATKMFEKIAETDDLVVAMLNGKMGITDIKEKKTANGTTTIFNFIDL